MDNVDDRCSSVKPFLRMALAIMGVATLCVGCAATPAQEDAKLAYRAPIYLTGSRIPVGRESPGSTKSADDRSPDDWQNALPPQMVHGTTGGGY